MGRFPVRSLQGNQYILLTYVYNANAILVQPMKSREISAMLDVFKSV